MLILCIVRMLIDALPRSLSLAYLAVNSNDMFIYGCHPMSLWVGKSKWISTKRQFITFNKLGDREKNGRLVFEWRDFVAVVPFPWSFAFVKLVHETFTITDCTCQTMSKVEMVDKNRWSSTLHSLRNENIFVNVSFVFCQLYRLFIAKSEKTWWNKDEICASRK